MATVPTDDVPAAHTSTDQWQSFEMRMRQRRIVRLLLRAQIAHEAGCDDEAREALEEAERLNAHAPGLAEMRAVLETQPEEPSPAPIPEPAITDLPAAPLAIAAPVITDVPAAELRIAEPPSPEFPSIELRTPEPPSPELRSPKPPSPELPSIELRIPEPPSPELPIFEPPSPEPASPEARIFETPSPEPRTNWLPRVAAAALIVGALAWFAVPRAFGPSAGTHADATRAVAGPSTTGETPSPATTSPASEPAAAGSAALPDVRIAVEEVAAATSAPPPPATAPAATVETAAAATALVGREIPEARSTTNVPPLETAPPAAARIETPDAPVLPPAIPVTTEAPLAEAASVPLAAPPPPRARAEAAVNEPVRDLPPARAVISPDAGVRAILARYESAYTRLDVDAAGSVWPALDRRALARAFDGLASQRVSLGSCDVNVAGETAVAACNGSATWTPKVGGGTRTQARQWEFRLKYVAGGWQIVGTSVK